jgi:hypothetical protein
LSAKLLSFIPGWAPKNKKHKKQKAMAKLLHSKPTHSFTNSHSQAAFCIFNFFLIFIFGKLMQHLSPKKFKDEYSFYTFLKIVFAKFDHTPNKSFARFRQVPSNLRQVFLPGFVLF